MKTKVFTALIVLSIFSPYLAIANTPSQPNTTNNLNKTNSQNPNPTNHPTQTMVIAPQNTATQNNQANPTKTPANNASSVQEKESNVLGLVYAAKKLEYGVSLYEAGSLEDSEKELKDLSEWLTDASQYHFELYKTFSKDMKTSDYSKIEKAYAHDFADLRDRCFFELAVVYIKQKKPQDAVYYLVEIVKSQPNSVFGKTAHDALRKIQFID